MGDRSVTVFVERDGTGKVTYCSPGVYLHWAGHETVEFLRAALPGLRSGDASYSAARFCGYCHTQLDGVTGLGLLPAPDDANDAAYLANMSDGYSHGDNGVFLVDVATWGVTNYSHNGELVIDLTKPGMP